VLAKHALPAVTSLLGLRVTIDLYIYLIYTSVIYYLSIHLLTIAFVWVACEVVHVRRATVLVCGGLHGSLPIRGAQRHVHLRAGAHEPEGRHTGLEGFSSAIRYGECAAEVSLGAHLVHAGEVLETISGAYPGFETLDARGALGRVWLESPCCMTQWRAVICISLSLWFSMRMKYPLVGSP
jgi:hypothetical protein